MNNVAQEYTENQGYLKRLHPKPDRHPTIILSNNIFQDRKIPLSSYAVHVALFIGKHLGWDPIAGAFNAFLWSESLQKGTGLKKRTIQRALNEISKKDLPLFSRTQPTKVYRVQGGEVVCYERKCQTFTLIWNPKHFRGGKG